MTLTYHRTESGKMPEETAKQVQAELARIPAGQKIALTVTAAPPFADMEPADRIAAIVEWYNALLFDYNDLDTLANYSRLLSCANADMGALSGDLRKYATLCEYRRKRHISQRIQQIKTSEQCSGAEAERKAEAEEETQQLREKEAHATGDADAATLILRTAGEVLSTMRQQIAMLRGEREDEKFGRGSQTA
jgi:hypothetical protein